MGSDDGAELRVPPTQPAGQLGIGVHRWVSQPPFELGVLGDHVGDHVEHRRSFLAVDHVHHAQRRFTRFLRLVNHRPGW